MSYNRKIFYMSFYEGEEKAGNAGYIKVLEEGEVQSAQVCLSGISALPDEERELEVMDGDGLLWKEKVRLKAGNVRVACQWEKRSDLSGLSFRVHLKAGSTIESKEPEGLYREALDRKAMVVDKTESISCKEEKKREEETWELQEIQPESKEEEAKVVQDEMRKKGEEEAEVVQDELKKKGKEEAVIVQDEPRKKGKEEVKIVQGEPEKKSEAKDKVEKRKWKQICKAYPHIKPFGDFREYIRLDLKDMVLLSEKRYSLVENSFLLHGYYNYEHIILWRKEKTPMKYYIGVPGNFYEKEKQVAVLYGFESFEGAVEPAKEGDFGYYMTEVTI